MHSDYLHCHTYTLNFKQNVYEPQKEHINITFIALLFVNTKLYMLHQLGTLGIYIYNLRNIIHSKYLDIYSKIYYKMHKPQKQAH